MKALYNAIALVYNSAIQKTNVITDDMNGDRSMNANMSGGELYKVLASLKSEEEFRVLFEDLCTFKELEQMEQRVVGAQLLLAGNTYAQVTSRTDISSATLSRISRCIQHGSGGYSAILKRYMQEKESGEES